MYEIRTHPEERNKRTESPGFYTWVFIILDFYYMGFFRNMVVYPFFCVAAQATRFTWDYYYMVLARGLGKLHYMGLFLHGR